MELLNIARKIHSDKQPAADGQYSFFEKAVSFTISPTWDLSETTKVDPMM